MSAAAPKPSIKSLVLAYLETHQPAIIDEAELVSIRRCVTASAARAKPPSDTYLLDILAATDFEIARSLGGLPVDLRGRVHVGDPEAAAASLADMQAEYAAARSQGDRLRAEDCRRAVRQGKARLRMMLRRPSLSAEKKQEKQELLQWFLVWLENPELFSQWLELRRATVGRGSPSDGPAERSP